MCILWWADTFRQNVGMLECWNVGMLECPWAWWLTVSDRNLWPSWTLAHFLVPATSSSSSIQNTLNNSGWEKNINISSMILKDWIWKKYLNKQYITISEIINTKNTNISSIISNQSAPAWISKYQNYKPYLYKQYIRLHNHQRIFFNHLHKWMNGVLGNESAL